MLTLSTFIAPSGIHGYGCFAGKAIREGEVVWILDNEADEKIRWIDRQVFAWEWEHAYRSHISPNLHILPRDNSAWINFANAEEPNLREGEMANGEPILIAARDIDQGEELTVGPETDADASEKLKSRG